MDAAQSTWTHTTWPDAARANRWWGRAFIALRCVSALTLLGCGSSRRVDDGLDDDPSKSRDAGGSADTTKPPSSLPQTGANATTLTVTGVKPGSGPFTGGNSVVVRGSGFTSDALVFIGGNMVQPASTTLEDRNSLRVVVPAGRVGLADVTVQIGKDEATREAAYTYHPLLIEPGTGSIAGGTSVQITVVGARLDALAQVTFDGAPCTEIRIVTPSQLRCKTPASKVGFADVKVDWPDVDQRPTLSATDAFEYLDLTDTDRGGLSGGPIAGTLNVTVVDAIAGFAVPGAFVLIGDALDGEFQGLTDDRGQITFSGDNLVGRVSIHVAAKCMERASIVAFDAQNVTVHMAPLLDPSCGMPGDPPPPGRGMAGSLVSGELIFPGSDEFAVNTWEIVPPPRANELRVAYVFTTRLRVSAPNPSPSASDTIARVTEDGSPIGVYGYAYRIFARPAGLAVYALSGLERRDTGEFIPYVMGIARDVLTAPGEETTGVDIRMDIPLDREQQVQLGGLPERTPRGPDQFRVQAHVDLGGEGVIVREVAGQSLDLVTSFTGGSLYRFFAQPGMIGSLSDGRYQMIAGWYSGDRDNTPPFTEVRRLGVEQSVEAVVIDDFLSIPAVLAPAEGARVPADRVLRWDVAGSPPDMYLVEILGGDGLPAWTQIVPGSVSESTIPDFEGIGELQDIAPGVISWSVRAIRIEDFNFDEFKYSVLSPRFWTHNAIDTFTMQR